MSRKFFIQQDSAKNHICEGDKEFNDALKEQNINAVLYMQTPNSPDISEFLQMQILVISGVNFFLK